MIERMEASKYVMREAGKYDIPVSRSCRVKLDIRSHDEVRVSFITANGEIVPYDAGRRFIVNAQLDDFAMVRVEGVSDFAFSGEVNHGVEYNDPTPAAVVAGNDPDPVRVAIADELRKRLHSLDLEKRMADEGEIDEMIDDFIDGDLEFEDGYDPFGLPAAAERAEEEAMAAAQAAREAAERERDGLDETPPEGKKPPASAVPAQKSDPVAAT